jgi:hypothetical protein
VRVELLFGSQSRARKEAVTATDELTNAFSEVEGEPDYPFSDAGRSYARLKKAQEAHARFTAAARAAATKGKP